MDVRRHTASALSGLTFLAGLIWLFSGTSFGFWPGILLVIAASSMVGDLIKGEWVDALVASFIFGGLFAWFTGRITAPAEIALPLGLIGVGLILLLNIFRRTERQNVKRKHKRQLEPETIAMLADEDSADILDLDTLFPEKTKRTVSSDK